nr:reverse transcriptase domain-containing protein [Tanacetum cinerariifolium]
MTHLLEKNTPFVFSEDCIKAFQTLKKKLTEAPILIGPNYDLPFELMCDARDFAIGAENLRADHLSRLENPHEGDLEKKEINETFPLETLRMISFSGDSSSSWFVDIANYHAGNFVDCPGLDYVDSRAQGRVHDPRVLKRWIEIEGLGFELKDAPQGLESSFASYK